MKKTGEIIGLPIVSIADGGEIGKVKSLVIDANEAAIAAITVEDGHSYKGAKLIYFNDILGIGEEALTIEQTGVIKDLPQVPDLEKLLEANVNVIKTKVISKKGHIRGIIVEVYFDADSGKIVECHAKTETGSDFTITANRLYTLGANMTVVVEDNDLTTVKPPETRAPQPPQQQPQTPQQQQPQPQQQEQQPPQEQQQQIAVVKPAPAEPAAAAEAAGNPSDVNNAMQKFEDRQKKFLIGKKATRKIVTDNGTEIIDQGEEVTEEIIQKAKLAGKFVELSMSLQ